MEKTVVNKIVQENMCCGCGICAGVCPSGCLQMAFNRYGEYQPQVIGECTKCQLCLKVCPFNEDTENEIADSLFASVPNINKNDIIGYNHKCFMGFCDKDGIREKGASGGMVTFLLSEMLNSKEIDGAIIVTPSDRNNILFESQIVRSIEEICNNAGSKYYPIEHSEVLKQIQEFDGSYAFVGLPCHIYGLRKAQRYSKLLRKRIKITFGLVCGHGVSAHFTDFLIDRTGLEKDAIQSLDYRGKIDTKTSNNYSFTVKPIDENKLCVRLPRQQSVYGQTWQRRMFVPNACDYCDDVFSELADATFMDAWLEEQIKDPKGNSIIVVRRPSIAKILLKSCERNECKFISIRKELVIESQKSQITYKYRKIVNRLEYAKRKKKWVPLKRRKASRKADRMETLEINIVNWNKWISSRAYCNKFIRSLLGEKLLDLCLPICIKGRKDLIAKSIFLPFIFIEQTTGYCFRRVLEIMHHKIRK